MFIEIKQQPIVCVCLCIQSNQQQIRMFHDRLCADQFTVVLI